MKDLPSRSLQDLIKILHATLPHLERNCRTVFILDSVDQIRQHSTAFNLSWYIYYFFIIIITIIVTII